MQPVRGVLLDIDGVLHVSMQPIAGAAETLNWLEQHGFATCFVTNTTTMARVTLAERLRTIGLPITEEHLITAPVATANYIRQHYPGKRCWVLTKGDTEADFAGIKLVQSEADVVVIGGAEELLTYESMNAAFRMLMDGAVLLAMHTNLYWRTRDGLRLDSGPFVRALEIASGKNDVAGAQQAGLRGVLVCTGKHHADSPLLERVHPDAILPSIVDLPGWMEEHEGA